MWSCPRVKLSGAGGVAGVVRGDQDGQVLTELRVRLEPVVDRRPTLRVAGSREEFVYVVRRETIEG